MFSESCTKFPSVRRVILTSSMSSVSFNGKPLNSDVTVDETWFSDPAYCESNKVCVFSILLMQASVYNLMMVIYIYI